MKRTNDIRLADDLLERFHSKLEVRGEDECWPWRGSFNTGGYGQIALCKGADRRMFLAHRVAYTLDRGEQPSPGLLVLHSCDNPACCNPRHLRAGTDRDNSDDKVAKGRHRSGMVGMRGVSHPRALYDSAYRGEAMRLYREERFTQMDIARRMGCHRQSVARWIKEAELAGG